jgi:hypothetical protein
MVHETLSQKTHHKKVGGVAQLVEGPPNKFETLTSNPSTVNKKKKKQWSHRE